MIKLFTRLVFCLFLVPRAKLQSSFQIFHSFHKKKSKKLTFTNVNVQAFQEPFHWCPYFFSIVDRDSFRYL